MVESIEERILLSNGLWLARLDGLPGDTPDEQIEAAQDLLHANRLMEDAVQVVDHTGVSGIVIIQTPVDATQEVVAQELQSVPGFLYVQEFDPDPYGVANPEEGEDEMFNPPDASPPLDPSPVDGGANLNVGLSGNEPAIAANPFNSNNIIVASYNNGAQSMKISLDGGATFPIRRNAQLPAGQIGFAGDDSLAFDAQGRLFWTFLTRPSGPSGINVFSQQVDPTTGALIGGPSQVATGSLDKEWLAADRNPSSPFANDLYSVWHDFGQDGAPVRFARSTNQGTTWTPLAGNLSGANEGFTWPAEVAVAPNGDVWVAWHTHTIGNGTNGEVRMRRSTDGGLTFGPEIVPFPAGTADAQVNAGSAEYGTPAPPRINQLKSWLQGSLQPRILADPAHPGTIYVVSVDDPDNVYDANGDPSDIVMARSTDNGATWTRTTISHGAPGTIQVMPAAAIDDGGRITVSWYDNRRGLTNASLDYLLDVYSTTSTDGGLTFGTDTRVNDLSFDPDLGAPDRYSPNRVLRIGEYNGLASAGGSAYAVWTGNTAAGQQIVFNRFSLGLAVSGSSPAGGSIVAAPPTGYVINFSDAVDPASLDAGDLKVNGSPASGVTLSVDHRTATFTFAVDPVASQGLQSMDIDAGSITRDGDPTSGISPFHATFRYDAMALQVASTDPPSPDGIFTLPAPLTFDVNFNEAVDPNSVEPGDLVLSGISGATVTGVAVLPGGTTARFTIGGVTSEGTLAASIAAGAITDAFGNPGLAFSGSYVVDIGTVPYPVPLSGEWPLGSLIYDPGAPGTVGPAGDTDTFTLDADPGQTITVLVTPTSPGLRPSVRLLDPSGVIIGEATASAAGQNALIQTAATAAGGTFRIVVGGTGSTTGSYTARVTLNAALEREANLTGVNDDSLATAQSLDGSFLSLATPQATVRRAAVVGSNSTPVTVTDFEDGPSGYTINNSLRGTGTGAGLWHLSTRRGPQTGHSPVTSFYYGSETTGNYDTGAANAGSITSPVIPLPASGPLTFSFNYVLLTEAGTGFDTANVQVSTNGFATFTTIGSRSTNLPNSSTWRTFAANVSSFAGQSVQFRFVFDTLDSVSNTTEGWYVDDVQVARSTAAWSDYYSVTVGAGDQVTVGLKDSFGTGTNVSLLDPAGATIATGVAGPTNLDRVIRNFSIPSSGVYYIVVSGSTGATYDVVVTQDAAFDTETNDSFATAQALGASTGALGAVGGSTQTLTFDEIPAQPVNGLTFKGISFGYTVNGVASTDAVYNRGGPGITAFTQDPALEGGTAGILTMDFATPTTVLEFGEASNATTTLANASTVALYSPDSTLIGMFTVAIGPNGFTFSSGKFIYSGSSPIARAVITFNHAAARFVIDNLKTSSDDEDWYAIDVTSPTNGFRLETSTPADGLGQFSNGLDPHIELYDPSGTLVASGLAGSDGRNESIQFQPTVAGTYRVRIVGENGTTGEYVLTRNFSPILNNVAVTPSIDENDVATLTGNIADPDARESFTLMLNWGDGSAPETYSYAAGTASFHLTHRYLDDNPTGTTSDQYPIAWTISDNHGASTTGGTAITVNNVGPSQVILGLSSGTIDENDTATLSGTFADPGTLDTHTVVIDWGDGSPTTTLNLAAGVLAFGAPHQYLDDSPSGTPSDSYAITVTVTDDDTGSGTASTAITVNNVPPVVAPIDGPAPGPGVRGQSLAFSGGFTDIGTLDTHMVSWDFGDGTVLPLHPSNDPGALTPSHVFKVSGTYVVTLTVQDDDTGITKVSKPITIGAVALQPDPLDPTRTTLAVGGTTSNDVIVFSPGAQRGSISVSINGVCQGTFAPTGMILAFGQGGDDNIEIAGCIGLDAMLFGDDGNDHLKGGAGNSLLEGGRGNDTLIGGKGRNILVGGAGADRLVGGPGDDVLIGGSTTYDANLAALSAILAEWARKDRSYLARKADLANGGGLNGSFVLDNTSVIDDVATDVLTGSSGEDWLILGQGDRKTGSRKGS